jgi:hypothetical protein
MAITATVSGGTVTTSIVRSDGKSQVVSVSIPGPKGDSGTVVAGENLNLSDLADLNTASLTDGSMLLYSESTGKWVAKNDLDTETGTITINAGNF